MTTATVPERYRDCIGLAGPEYEFDVERGKVHEFARTLFSFRPEYLEGRHPPIFPTQLVVAGYLWGYMLEDPQGTDLQRVDLSAEMSLDAEQEFVFPSGPPRAGTRLFAKTSVDAIWEKQSKKGGRLTFYRTRTDFRSEERGLEAIHYSTSFVPEHVPESEAPPSSESSDIYWHHGETRPQFAKITPATWESLRAGETPGAITLPPQTLTEQVCYQIVSGNYGASHHDRIAAHAEGFPDWFSIGMYQAGLATTYAVNWLGPNNIRAIKFRFRDTVWPGDRLTYDGRIENLEVTETARLAHVAISCNRAGGGPVVDCTANFAVPADD